MSQLVTSSGQSIGTSASSSVLPMNIQGWFPLGLTGLISFLSKGLSRVFSSTTIQKHQFFGTQPSLWSNSHIQYTTTGETTALTLWTFVSKVMSLLYNMLSRFVIVFLPRSKYLLILWLHSPSAMILQPKKMKSVSTFPHQFAWSDRTRCHDLSFWMLDFKPAFSLSSFTFIKRLFSSSSLSADNVLSSAYLRLWYFSQQSWFQLVLHPDPHFAWCTLHIT